MAMTDTPAHLLRVRVSQVIRFWHPEKWQFLVNGYVASKLVHKRLYLQQSVSVARERWGKAIGTGNLDARWNWFAAGRAAHLLSIWYGLVRTKKPRNLRGFSGSKGRV